MKNVNFKNLHNKHSKFDIVNLDEFLSNQNASKFIFNCHIIKFFAILFVENGSGHHNIDFKSFNYRKGTLFAIRKDQIHQFCLTNNVKGKLLLFTDEFLVSHQSPLNLLKPFQIFNHALYNPKTQLTNTNYKVFYNLVKRIEKEYFNEDDNLSLEIIRSELQILLTKLYRIRSKNRHIQINKPYLNYFVNFQNLVETNVFKSNKVKYYAKLLGVSTKFLNTITSSIINKSAKVFIDDVYIKQIKRLLINSNDMSIKEISFKAGFKETTNFHNYFKRHTQQTPKQFRRNLI